MSDIIVYTKCSFSRFPKPQPVLLYESLLVLFAYFRRDVGFGGVLLHVPLPNVPTTESSLDGGRGLQSHAFLRKLYGVSFLAD